MTTDIEQGAIDPGSPAWEDARAVLVAELRKGGHSAASYQVSNGQPCEVPSHIALNLIAHAAARTDVRDKLFVMWAIANILMGEEIEVLERDGSITRMKAGSLQFETALRDHGNAMPVRRAALSHSDGDEVAQAIWDACPINTHKQAQELANDIAALRKARSEGPAK